MKKKLCFWMLGILMLISGFSMEAMAAAGDYAGQEESVEAGEYVWVNPMHPEADEPALLDEPQEESMFREERAGSASGAFQTVDGAAKTLRRHMVNRDKQVLVLVRADGGGMAQLARTVLDRAMAVNSQTAGNEGDYIQWHTGSVHMSVIGGAVGYSISYTMNYYTTRQQEEQVTAKVKKVLSSLGMSKRTAYGKTKAIYDYICKNVKYDYDGLNNGSLGKFTAYNALIKGKSVCQGYASLFYRMARDAGLQVRFIPGASRSEPHAWNIVKLGTYYYNLDSTWDAGRSKYVYFLKSNKEFPDHARSSGYATAAFNREYPMSPKSYKATSVYSIVNAKASGVKNKTYTGKKQTQNPLVKLGNATLKKDRDYTISYKNNVKVGTATMTLKGKGNYSGTLKKTFKITLKKGGVYRVGAYKYRVMNVGASGKGTVNLAGGVNKAISSVNVHNEVKIGGKTMKVTGISIRAFKNCKNLTKVSIGENVKSIGDQAFYGASQLKLIVIKGRNLKKVGPKAFQGIHREATIQVKSGMLRTYKALLRGKGQPKPVVIR